MKRRAVGGHRSRVKEDSERTSENKKVKKSFSVERSPECVLGYEEGARERKRLNQSMKEERDQSKIKKICFFWTFTVCQTKARCCQ